MVAARGDAAGPAEAGETAGAVAIVEPLLAALGDPATPIGPLTAVAPELGEPDEAEALPAIDPVAADPVMVVPVGPPTVPVMVVPVDPPMVVPVEPPTVPPMVVPVEPPTVPPMVVPVDPPTVPRWTRRRWCRSTRRRCRR